MSDDSSFNLDVVNKHEQIGTNLSFFSLKGRALLIFSFP